jgi:undecaprenyl-diphosphatase
MLKGALNINALVSVDHELADWFHQHVSHASAQLLHAVTEAGSGMWIGIVLFFCVLVLAWRRHWYRLMALLLTVPGGMLLNLAIKFAVQRQRPFACTGWDGYSFPSGHSNGATLLYGILAVGFIPLLRRWHWRMLTTVGAVLLVLLVGFSRIALGAHYLTDVVGGMALGLVWLVLCLTVVRLIRDRLPTFHLHKLSFIRRLRARACDIP